MILLSCSRKKQCVKVGYKAVWILLFALLCLSSLVCGQSLDEDVFLQLAETARESTEFADRFDEEVWFTDMSGRMQTFVKDDKQRKVILKKIHMEAKRAKLNPKLILALIQTESAFDSYAVSSAGAQGLMQVMPFWKQEIGSLDDNLISIDTNLRYGCTILSLYLEKEKGNLTRALARYNGSLGEFWYPERVYTNLEKYWQ
ncbi:MAG: lytic transglycosylase domain-containing protein [Candidatus Endonucleobacter bathymodioli]|uniref:Lytic transglycosylase domain-containing protein n=1 Tax=Candidatus Endonucleibacter bathymodioli TaxID=539814 RepID=A0AA90NNH8_9GAMM|nr:lytic transglycosylase domain-containing protein [Candidatus Endonucleobacter bathymodioli]